LLDESNCELEHKLLQMIFHLSSLKQKQKQLIFLWLHNKIRLFFTIHPFIHTHFVTALVMRIKDIFTWILSRAWLYYKVEKESYNTDKLEKNLLFL